MANISDLRKDPDRLMDTEELAGVLGRSASSLKRDRKAGRGCPYIPLGRGAVRYRAGDVMQWLESLRVGSGL